jgi:hypothetical protein
MTAISVPRTPFAPIGAAVAHHSDVAARAVGAVALASLALIHVEDLPDTFSASRLVGAEYIALVAVSLLLAAALVIRRAGTRLWLAAAALAGSAMLAYVLSRTTGIPGDHADVGNWRCSLGLGALTVETMILTLSAWATHSALRSRQRAGRRTRGRRTTKVDQPGALRNQPRPSSWAQDTTRVSHQLRVRSGP